MSSSSAATFSSSFDPMTEVSPRQLRSLCSALLSRASHNHRMLMLTQMSGKEEEEEEEEGEEEEEEEEEEEDG